MDRNRFSSQYGRETFGRDDDRRQGDYSAWSGSDRDSTQDRYQGGDRSTWRSDDHGYGDDGSYGGYRRDFSRENRGSDDDRGYGRQGSPSRSSFGASYGNSNDYGSDYGRSSGRDDRWSAGGYGGNTGEDRSSWRSDERGRSGEKRGFMDRATDEVASWFGNEDAERRRMMDQHRGKGPKGYTRSDDRIRDDLNDRLADDGRLDASDIEATVASGEVTLSGTVTSRQDKRYAEDLAEAVSGVKHVQNNLRVKSSVDLLSDTDRATTTNVSGSTASTAGRLNS
nr:BON domain-containing protein [Xaviernesmea oryzae]